MSIEESKSIPICDLLSFMMRQSVLKDDEPSDCAFGKKGCCGLCVNGDDNEDLIEYLREFAISSLPENRRQNGSIVNINCTDDQTVKIDVLSPGKRLPVGRFLLCRGKLSPLK
jgi:hypothetical protein